MSDKQQQKDKETKKKKTQLNCIKTKVKVEFRHGSSCHNLPTDVFIPFWSSRGSTAHGAEPAEAAGVFSPLCSTDASDRSSAPPSSQSFAPFSLPTFRPASFRPLSFLMDSEPPPDGSTAFHAACHHHPHHFLTCHSGRALIRWKEIWLLGNLYSKNKWLQPLC